jgi:hypothetical protein
LPIAYSVTFTQAARRELIEAQDWYEGEATGLGRFFCQAIDALVDRMSDNPRRFPVVFPKMSAAPSSHPFRRAPSVCPPAPGGFETSVQPVD